MQESLGGGGRGTKTGRDPVVFVIGTKVEGFLMLMVELLTKETTNKAGKLTQRTTGMKMAMVEEHRNV